MSLDNFVECSTCGKHMAVKAWQRLYGSLNLARLQSCPDFIKTAAPGPVILKIAAPGPIILKIEMCFACGRFAPTLDYSAKEQSDLDEYNKQNAEIKQMVEKIEAVLGQKPKEPD